MSRDCYFCPASEQTALHNTVFEDAETIILVADDWVVKGHTLVVWKKHAVNISDLTEKEYSLFSKRVYITEKVLLSMLKKDRSVILKSGGIVSHFHFHIYPVTHRTRWQEIKDMFDMKLRYIAKSGEKESFMKDFQEKLMNASVL